MHHVAHYLCFWKHVLSSPKDHLPWNSCQRHTCSYCPRSLPGTCLLTPACCALQGEVSFCSFLHFPGQGLFFQTLKLRPVACSGVYWSFRDVFLQGHGTSASHGQGGLWPEITSGPQVLVLLEGMDSNKRQQIRAKSGEDLFEGKQYTPDRTWMGSSAGRNPTKCPEQAAQLAET